MKKYVFGISKSEDKISRRCSAADSYKDIVGAEWEGVASGDMMICDGAWMTMAYLSTAWAKLDMYLVNGIALLYTVRPAYI